MAVFKASNKIDTAHKGGNNVKTMWYNNHKIYGVVNTSSVIKTNFALSDFSYKPSAGGSLYVLIEMLHIQIRTELI